MRASAPALLAALALGGTLTGCRAHPNALSGLVTHPSAPPPGVVSLVTKNTTRIGGADPVSDAAAVARVVYPGLTSATRPAAVALVNDADWPAAIAASELAGGALGAPLLYAEGNSLPSSSEQALLRVRPRGAAALGASQVIEIGTSARVPRGYRVLRVPAAIEPAAEVAAIERVYERARGGAPHQVIVLAAGSPRALQMPAAGLSAESGAPILFITSAAVPAATAAVLARLHRPAIFLLGAGAVAAPTLKALGRLGSVTAVSAGAGSGSTPSAAEQANPVDNAIAVSRFGAGSFGWNIHEAGHGLAFADAAQPLDAPAAAPLSASGDYAPLLLLEGGASLPSALAAYLSDIEPGYSEAVPAVRGVYNHGWLIGGEAQISAHVQAEIDALLEISPGKAAPEEGSVAPAE